MRILRLCGSENLHLWWANTRNFGWLESEVCREPSEGSATAVLRSPAAGQRDAPEVERALSAGMADCHEAAGEQHRKRLVQLSRSPPAWSRNSFKHACQSHPRGLLPRLRLPLLEVPSASINQSMTSGSLASAVLRGAGQSCGHMASISVAGLVGVSVRTCGARS